MSEKKNHRLLVPSMGEGVSEVTIVSWLKKEGDKIEKDDPIVEVSTDKVDTEISSPHEGFLISIFCKEGDTVAVDKLIAQISEDKNAPVISEQPLQEEPEDSKVSKFESHDNQKDQKSNFPESNLNQKGIRLPEYKSSAVFAGYIAASPLARKMAADFNISLGDVEGSGLYGRVTKDDIEKYVRSHSESNLPREEDLLLTKVLTEKKDSKEYLQGVEVKRVKMTKIRRLTAEHMVRSVRTSPHATLTIEVNLNNVLQYKTEKAQEFLEKNSCKLTLTSFFISASIFALQAHPEVNCSIDGDDILYKDDINIGCAVATETGLLVPVLKKTNKFSLDEVAIELASLVTKARNNKLEPQDIVGGTFSITNPGMYGTLNAQPIINQPQVGILSIGCLTERPVLRENNWQSHSFCQIGLTFDHRVIDGEGAAKFLGSIKEFLENYS
ncbi:MAG: hypothetical protein CMP11_07005 [Zetaproteobacteria bacterium]|nr:hypothetical protein [Pseudobdellovibrionaceae bacterium]